MTVTVPPGPAATDPIFGAPGTVTGGAEDTGWTPPGLLGGAGEATVNDTLLVATPVDVVRLSE